MKEARGGWSRNKIHTYNGACGQVHSAAQGQEKVSSKENIFLTFLHSNPTSLPSVFSSLTTWLHPQQYCNPPFPPSHASPFPWDNLGSSSGCPEPSYEGGDKFGNSSFFRPPGDTNEPSRGCILLRKEEGLVSFSLRYLLLPPVYSIIFFQN